MVRDWSIPIFKPISGRLRAGPDGAGAPGHHAIVEAAVTLAQHLNLSVVAEGVETPAAWRRLRELGCDTAQGYLLSRPLAALDLEAWSAAGGPKTALESAYSSQATFT